LRKSASDRSSSRHLPASVAAVFDSVDELVDNYAAGDFDGGKIHKGSWRKLHESKHGEAHEIDIGDGFTIQVHMLY